MKGKIFLMILFVYGCSQVNTHYTNDNKVVNKEVHYNADSIPITFPIIVNKNDFALANKDFQIIATLSNDYMFKLARKNGKQNYLTAKYYGSSDSIAARNSYEKMKRTLVKGDTAIVKISGHELKGESDFFYSIRLEIDFSDKYPGPDTMLTVFHSFRIKK